LKKALVAYLLEIKKSKNTKKIIMKTFKRVLIWMAILPMAVVISCKDDDPVAANENYADLTEYLVASNLDLPAVLDGWIVGPPTSVSDVAAFLEDYYVMDIRAAADFDKGHVNGAVNSTLGTIVADAAASNKTILVVCYTGQTASHAAVALRLSGYRTAKVLKWGMSGWRADLAGSWLANSGDDNGNIASANSNWVTTSTATPETFNAPEWTSSATTPAEMLTERVTYMTTNGFQGVPSADVLASPTDYFINNYWAETDLDHYGHINSAFRILPLSIANDEFKYYDPSKTAVTYCWTGQTSSMVTAYLTVLGFNAKSLKFGANSMIYSTLESHKFVQPTVDLPVVTD
jgi:rhodanese-related sulfurtransferase